MAREHCEICGKGHDEFGLLCAEHEEKLEAVIDRMVKDGSPACYEDARRAAFQELSIASL